MEIPVARAPSCPCHQPLPDALCDNDVKPSAHAPLSRYCDAVGAGELGQILAGLCDEPKRLPCKLFYDTRGSRLFEQICNLPEYYLTRAESEIIERHGSEIAAEVGAESVIVELGSGSSRKTRLLLDALASARIYIPIDISEAALHEAASALGRRYPKLDVRPVVGDYLAPLKLPLGKAEKQRVTVFFPGSTIGNFQPSEAVAFLGRLRRDLGNWQRWLVGVDLPKDPATLVAAYADEAGVTAAFNLNILQVINQRFGANFALRHFRHRARYDEALRRIEMQVVSQRWQSVRVGGRTIELAPDEAIVTEHCYKYTPADFANLVAGAGFRRMRTWFDPRARFSVHLMEAH